MNEFTKLKWQCRRGMRELDVLLICYLEQHYLSALPLEQQTFQALLELSDLELYDYVIGRATPTDKNMSVLVAKVLTPTTVE